MRGVVGLALLVGAMTAHAEETRRIRQQATFTATAEVTAVMFLSWEVDPSGETRVMWATNAPRDTEPPTVELGGKTPTRLALGAPGVWHALPSTRPKALVARGAAATRPSSRRAR